MLHHFLRLKVNSDGRETTSPARYHAACEVLGTFKPRSKVETIGNPSGITIFILLMVIKSVQQG